MTSININRYISTQGNPRSIGAEPSSISVPNITTTLLTSTTINSSSITSSALTSSSVTSNALTLNETTAPTGAAGKTILYMDNTDHTIKSKANGDVAASFVSQDATNSTISFTTPGGSSSLSVQFTRTNNAILMKVPQLTVTYVSNGYFSCTLPVGYRPSNPFTDSVVVVQSSGTSLGRIDIGSTGALQIGSDPAGNQFTQPGSITLEAFYISYSV